MATNCGTKAASANRRKARFQKEDLACPGKLYPTLAQRHTYVMRQVGSGLNMEKKTVRSEEIRADRMITTTYATSAKSAGKIDMELSAGSFDPFLEGYIGANWTTTMSYDLQKGEHVAFTTVNTIEVTGVDLSNVYSNGSIVKTEGFLNEANNRYWTVTAVAYSAATDKTTLTVAETAIVEAGNVYGALSDAGDVLVNGTTLKISAGGILEDTVGATVFQAARAAGKLERGTHVMLQGLGLATGSVAFTGVPVDGETLVINNVTFEFDNDGIVGIGAVPVTIGADANTTATNLATAIMKELAKKRVFVSANATTGTVALKALKNDPDVVNSVAGTVTNATVTNFTGGDSTKEGIFKIIGVSDTQLTLSPTPTADANAGGLRVVLKGSHLTPPNDPTQILKQTFRIEDEFTDINSVLSYHNQSVSGISLELSAEDLVKGNVEFVGAEVQALTATEIGNTTTNVVHDVLNTPLYNATTDVTAITLDGSEFPATVMSFSIEMKTEVKQFSAIGSYFPTGTNPGSLAITGKLDVYFENLTMFNKFFNNVYINIGLTLEDIDGNTYVFSIPRAFMSKDEVDTGGLDDTIMEKIEWTADVDPVTNKSILMSRFSSSLPHTA